LRQTHQSGTRHDYGLKLDTLTLVDTAVLISTLLTETPLPTPNSSGASSASDGDSWLSQWLPLGTALIAALAAIGASALTQFLSARNETIRRAEQYKREDLQRRREELKLTYSDLIRHLDEYLIVAHRSKTTDSIMDSLDLDTPADGVRKLMAKQNQLTEQMIVTVSAINSLLGVVDLLGETDVFDACYEYVGYIQDMQPEDDEDKAKGQQLNSAMKDAMRRSLAGEQDTAK
jgi:hypothetical protein